MVESERVYPFLIFGVGLSETILNSAMATRKQPSVNIEFGKVWSGATKTLTVREIENLFKGTGRELAREELEAEGHRDTQRNVRLKFYEDGLQSTADFVKRYGFRDFNIDFNPKLIVVPSKAANHLIEAHVDEYLQFSTVNHLLHAEGLDGPTEPVPLGREGIFNNGSLSLTEKKELYNFLNIAVRLCRGDGEDEDVNSIDDFKKNLYVEISGAIKKIRAQRAGADHQAELSLLEFFEAAGLKSPRLVRLVAYCLCNYRINPYLFASQPSKFEHHTMKDALARLARFIESLMDNGFKIPYKYTRYGSGDISQICTRIGSVYESFTMLEQKLQIVSAAWEEGPVAPLDDKEDKKQVEVGEKAPIEIARYIRLETVLNGEKQTIKAKKIYMGPEYRYLGHQIKFLLDQNAPSQEGAKAGADPAAGESRTEKVRWFTFVANWVRPDQPSEDAEEEAPEQPQVYPFPALMYIDLSSDPASPYKHPVQVLILDHTAGVAAAGCVLLNFSYYCEESAESPATPKLADEDLLFQSVSRRLSQKFPQQVKELTPVFKLSFEQEYEHAEYRVLSGGKGPQNGGITLLPDADFELEMERVFCQARDELLADGAEDGGKLFLRDPIPSPIFMAVDGTIKEHQDPEEEETEEDRILKELENFEL